MMMIVVMMTNISLSQTARLQGNDDDGSRDNDDHDDDDGGGGKQSNIRNRK